MTPKQQLANDDDTGPRRSAIVMAKEGRRLRDERTAAQNPPASARTGDQQPNPTPRKSAIVAVRDRKTAHCQREQQQIAMLLPIDGKQRSAIVGKSREPDMTPEEHQRRGDAADAMFREMKRQIAAALKRP
ncbi:MAG TPA: hypothetical protein VFL55_22200 [Acetobacteraceae bacterium]|nr:hypothetical protein [Acetobacteraceae bacterium]